MWWWVAAALCFLIQFVGLAFISYYWQSGYAWRWVLTSLVIVVYILVILKTGLRSNHRINEIRLLPGLGIGNWITLLRAILIAILAGLLFLPWSEFADKFSWLAWLPGTIYLSAVILDYFDGFAARITDHQTRLGEEFDTKVDALGLLFASLVAIKIGQLPIFYLSVGAAYYLFQIGIWYREKYSKPLIVLKPHPQARLMAGFQMGFVSFTLFPVLRPPITTVAAFVFMIPFLLGFLRDWLVICGQLATGHCQKANWENKLYRSVIEMIICWIAA
jgi:CDP-diacylglycerol--glycerol-3-phosphate 3-phosphatidyltransferase